MICNPPPPPRKTPLENKRKTSINRNIGGALSGVFGVGGNGKATSVKSGRVKRCSKSLGSGRVCYGHFIILRVGSGRVGSGRVRSGRVGSGRVGTPFDPPRPAASDQTPENPWFLARLFAPAVRFGDVPLMLGPLSGIRLWCFCVCVCVFSCWPFAPMG